MRPDVLRTIARNNKVRVLAAIFILAAVANVGFYYTKAVPAREELTAAESELAAAKKQAGSVEARIKSYDRLIETRRQIDEFRGLLLTTSGYTMLLKDMYDLGKKRGMLEGSFGATAREVKAVGGMETITFVYPVSGSYRDVREFIHEVETSDMFLNINNLSLSSGGKDGRINLQINLSTYVRQ